MNLSLRCLLVSAPFWPRTPLADDVIAFAWWRRHAAPLETPRATGVRTAMERLGTLPTIGEIREVRAAFDAANARAVGLVHPKAMDASMVGLFNPSRDVVEAAERARREPARPVDG